MGISLCLVLNMQDRTYHYFANKDVPSAFWLFVLDKAIYWDQSPRVIKDDEEVQVEWEDVKGRYQNLRRRIKWNVVHNGKASFWANGYYPNSVGSDDKTEFKPDIIDIDMG